MTEQGIEHWDGTHSMDFVRNDGGRAAAGYKGSTGDCVCRSIAIATGKPYQEVYDALNGLAAGERWRGRRRGRKSTARDGVYKETIRRYMASIGWTWVPTMRIGQGCKVHLLRGELPMGRLVVSVSKHCTAVIDGVIHDTSNPTRAIISTMNGVEKMSHRCVYGYWTEQPAT